MTEATAAARVLDALREHDRFLVAAHASPDGDAMGSTAAMGWLLQALGKRFVLCNVSGLPDEYDWLDLPSPMHKDMEGCESFAPQAAVILDSGSLSRIGDDLAVVVSDLECIVNIDHHMDNPGFGTVNWVDRQYAAVGEMVAELARLMDQPLSGPMGEAVYLTLVADTGYFRYDNTRPETMELGASIIRAGLNPGLFSARYVNQWSLNRLQLWGEVLGQTQVLCDGRLGMLAIPLVARERTGTTVYDCDGLVDYVRRLKSVRIACVLREDAPDRIKFSLRSTGAVNVQAIAAQFGGGGHHNAAGATFEGSLEQARQALMQTACKALGNVDAQQGQTVREVS